MNRIYKFCDTSCMLQPLSYEYLSSMFLFVNYFAEGKKFPRAICVLLRDALFSNIIIIIMVIIISTIIMSCKIYSVKYVNTQGNFALCIKENCAG